MVLTQLFTNSHRDVALQGALAIPLHKEGEFKFVCPDHCIGSLEAPCPTEWQKLRAGKFILPIDLVEYKHDTNLNSPFIEAFIESLFLIARTYLQVGTDLTTLLY